MAGPASRDLTGATLGGLLIDRAERTPGRLFISFPDQDTTYRALADESRALAKGLLARGLAPGDHVAVLMPNCLQWLEVFFAVHLAGGVVVPVNTRFKRRELSYIVAHCDARFLVTTDLVNDFSDFTALLWDALPGLADPSLESRATGSRAAGSRLALPSAPRLEAVFLAGDKQMRPALPLATLIADGEGIRDEELNSVTAGRSAEDVAVVLYTSGTTADPKGCELTHGALLRSWSAYAGLIGLGAEQSIWTPCPFFHVGGIGILTAALTTGAAMVTMSHFEGRAALDHIERLHAEHLFPAFPALTLGLLRADTYQPGRITFVRTVLNVAPLETQQLIEHLLPSGAVLLNDFGMTEGAGMITVTSPQSSAPDRLGSNGVPLPGTEVRITDPEDPQTVLGPDKEGEIQFRGANTFRSYYKDPEATARTILAGGWVRTGDLGRIDARGQLHFADRIKDVLKVGGENVSALEVEAYLSTHPAVTMAQVVARPSARYGQEPVAFVELMPGAECTPQDIVGFCTGRLASYKIPRDVVFVTEWPMSATKIQKFRLREMLEGRVEDGG